MSVQTRFSFGQSIIEVRDSGRDDEPVYITVSKERWDVDHIQFVVPRHVAKAMGQILLGDEQ
jgi:hypothetical protein